MMNPMTKVSQVRISSPILSGLFYSLLFMIIATLIASAILMFTNVEETSLSTYTYIIHCISMFIGGIVAGKRAGGRGWYYGGIMGAVYAIIILLIGFLGFDAVFKTHRLLFIALAFVMGALGGILGVNTRK